MTYEESLWAIRLSGLVIRQSFDRRIRLTGWICFWEDGADNETALADGHLFWAQPHQRQTQTDHRFPEKVSVWQTELQIGSAALSGTSAGGKVNRYQRPAGSLGCNVHHKAECLCWGCSICVFRVAGGRTCFILLVFRDSICVITHLICLCVHAFYFLSILVCGICALCWLWQVCITFIFSSFYG